MKGVDLKTHKRIDKSILTTEGTIFYSRYVLRPSDHKSCVRLGQICGKRSVVPLDCALGIDSLPFKITCEMMAQIAYYATKMGSYQAAEELLERSRNIKLNDDTIRKVTNYIGEIVYREDCLLADKAMRQFEEARLPYTQEKDGVLYIETDGAAVNTRTRDEHGSSWRENKLGLVFSSDSIYHWKNSRGEPQHRIMRKEYISLVGGVDEFKKHLLALAVRNGLGEYKNTVILSDGATWIRNMKEELFPDAQQILDLFHAKENIHSFSKLIYADENTARGWAEKICDLLEKGETAEMFKILEKYKDRKVPAGTVNIYNYLRNNADNINYPLYKEKGYFVGSGAIESGNKTVVQSRLKLAGMRWNVETAQFVLSLKSKMESGLWDSYVVPLVRNFMRQQ